MKKIPSLFARDAQGNLVTEYHPKADWVVRGEGVPTRKWDGTAVMIKDGLLYARYDCKRGKTPPAGFIPCQDPDPVTGHWPGWVLANRPEDKWIRAALDGTPETNRVDGTFEAVGERIGGNPERVTGHFLVPHGKEVLSGCPRDLDGLRSFFAEHDIEGVVWWRDQGDIDCDKVKITAAALGMKRGKRGV